MNSFESLGLKHDGRTLWVLDQTQLPDAETWLDGSQPEAMIALIQRLAVRGALSGHLRAPGRFGHRVCRRLRSTAICASHGREPDVGHGSHEECRRSRP